MLVRDKMTRDVITITPDQSLRMAKERLRKHGVRRLPVVRDGKLVGIVTDRDVRRAWASPATSLSTHKLLYLLDRVTVEEVMTPQPLTVTPETPLLEAARLLHDRRIGGLPVVEGGTVVGIITETDLLGAFIEMFEPSKGTRAPTRSFVS
jgi:acetoin utilization protein AcuB